ncbi:MAG: PEP-CTERM sorting domain-containing protein [Nostoc sp. DedVER02]|uniref:Npun_F0296 family exosortase-dependent surface protein n=1 Tax=unclassified Nostoc TaxID=2593658 RepID=UPI002AD34938|nr:MULTISPECIES: PEP-CTERM sorting domain-containing protein [unclassified Nostoc]MDZ7987718.1 PEP-CTERM sorting domain-containing protein [Nostoc sp. DedVER02]MDZ8116125.1 PEP-CTERM sorting domain-containing protein [Nostoc sp. DedVER01b]
MSIKKIACIAALSLSAISSFVYAGSAQAISFQVTTGIAGLNGETNQGAFSEFSKLSGTTTIDFNNGQAPTTGFAQYSFENTSGSSSVRSDVWAPAGANGEVNDGKYLAVFSGDKVTISLGSSLNYFGIDWGAISSGNMFSFYNGDTLIKSFTTEDVNPVAPIRASQHGGEGNGYLHFYSDSSNDIFNKIVITQTGGGGFESDNHSFHAGTDKFTGFDPKSVPEPSVTLGMLAVGGMFLRKRKNDKLQSVKQSY